MKALIVGGSKGFGQDISNEFKNRDFDVITVGRSKTSDYVCDVGDLGLWRKVLEEIKIIHNTIDVVVFVAGFARAKNVEDLTETDWNEHLSKNLIYVALGLSALSNSLLASTHPKVVTIGSQWSYKIGSNELVPYTVSKHALDTLTKDFALRNKGIQANHYCIPTTDTDQYKKVQESFNEIGKIFTPIELAAPKEIAQNLVRHILSCEKTGATLVLDPKGTIKEL